jgi:hypothetical protein
LLNWSSWLNSLCQEIITNFQSDLPSNQMSFPYSG